MLAQYKSRLELIPSQEQLVLFLIDLIRVDISILGSGILIPGRRRRDARIRSQIDNITTGMLRLIGLEQEHRIDIITHDGALIIMRRIDHSSGQLRRSLMSMLMLMMLQDHFAVRVDAHRRRGHHQVAVVAEASVYQKRLEVYGRCWA